MVEEETRGIRVRRITARIERGRTADEMERFIFLGSDRKKYYVSLETRNRSAELVAVSLVRDAFVHDKSLDVWWELRDRRRMVKAIAVSDPVPPPKVIPADRVLVPRR